MSARPTVRAAQSRFAGEEVVLPELPHADAACDHASQAERRGQMLLAERAYRRAVELDPRHCRSRLLFSQFLLAQHRHDEAAQEAQAAFRCNVDAQTRQNLIEVLSQQAFSLASHQDVTRIDFDALTAIAQQLITLKALEPAESILRFAVDVGVAQAGAVVLVRLLLAQQRVREAEAISDQLRGIDRESPWALLCDLTIAVGRDEMEAAAERLTESLRAGGAAIKAIERLLGLAATDIDTPQLLQRLAAWLHARAHHDTAATLCEVLAKHGRARPHGLDLARNAPDEALTHEDLALRRSLESGSLTDPMVDLLAHPERIGTVVAINFWGRSGSFLLSSMFDGHPQVLQILPPQSMMSVVDRVLCEPDRHGSIPALVNAVVSCFAAHGWDGNWDALPESAAGTFAEMLRHGFTRLAGRGYLNIAMVLRVVHIAHAIAAGIVTEGDPIIVFQSHNGMRAKRQQLDALIPQMQFITSVRFPERSYDSHVHKHYHDLPLGDPIYLPNLLFRWLIDMGEELPALHAAGRSAAIRFEDLHQATGIVMRTLCERIGLPWHPRLLESTEAGSPFVHVTKRAQAGGANSGTRRLKPADFATAMSFWWDRWKLRLVLEENYRAWGYESEKRPLVPRGAARWLTRHVLLHLPWKMHLIAFRAAIPEAGLAQSLRRLIDSHRILRGLVLDELARRATQPPGLIALAYPLAAIPEDIRFPQEQA